MNDDFPWFLLAMVVIAFLRWVSLKLQGKSGAPEHDFTEIEDENIFAEMEPGPEPPPPHAKQGGTPSEEFRRFIEALSGSPPVRAAQAPMPTSLPSPPPVPYAEAMEGVRQLPQPATLGIDRDIAYQIRSKRPHSPHDAPGPVRQSQVRSLLASSSGLKNAVLLREILGEPKGLKGFEDSPTF